VLRNPPVIRDLGLPPGAVAATANGINSSGTIVGTYHDGVTQRGFTWTSTGGFTTLGGPPGAVSASLKDINDAGTIVGDFNDGFTIQAFRYTTAGGYEVLHPALHAASHAEAINNNGLVVGWVTTLALENHAGAWDAAGAFTDVGGLGTPIRGFAWDINDRDHLVGSVDAIAEGFAQPFGGGMMLLNGMGDTRGISPRNRIVGQAFSFPNAATVRGATAAADTLPLLATSSQALARKVSACGHIVGRSTMPGSLSRATAWRISACD
jgi:probable HAF family extracellular repeat protein